MDYKNKPLLKYYFSELKRIAKKRHCLFIKFDPAIHVNDYKSNEYIKKHVKEAEEIVLDKRKSYTHEEMIAILKKEGL